MIKYNLVEKKVDSFNGKKVYLIGTDKNGDTYWLVEPSWDCDWYWGFGYLQVYTGKLPHLSKDINIHTHVSSISKDKCLYDVLSEFESLTLTSDELWEFTDYMKTFYTLRDVAELFSRGYSHVTERAKLDCLKKPELAAEINTTMMKTLFEKIISLLEERK